MSPGVVILTMTAVPYDLDQVCSLEGCKEIGCLDLFHNGFQYFWTDGVYQFILYIFAHIMGVTAGSTFRPTDMLLHHITSPNLHRCSSELHPFRELPSSGLFRMSVDPLKARFLSAKDWIIATNRLKPHITFFSQPQQVPSPFYLLSGLLLNGPPCLSMLPC